MTCQLTRRYRVRMIRSLQRNLHRAVRQMMPLYWRACAPEATRLDRVYYDASRVVVVRSLRALRCERARLWGDD